MPRAKRLSLQPVFSMFKTPVLCLMIASFHSSYGQSPKLIYGEGLSLCVELNSLSTISTYAGNGMGGTAGDGSAATSAQVNPWAVAIDRAGNLYIADIANSRVRKVSTSGTITTVAGTGEPGYNGDNIPATNAYVQPSAVVVDSANNLYIADTTSRVRKVSTSGIITTIAGNGTSGYNGDNIAATTAELSGVRGLALDTQGNLYIADTGNNRVREVAVSGVITTVAGNGVAGFTGNNGVATSAELNSPTGVALGSSGNIYISDAGNHWLREVTASNGLIQLFAGSGASGYSGDGGAAIQAKIAYPLGISIDPSGNVYFADSGNARVREVSAGGYIFTVAGDGASGFSGDGGSATSAEISQPLDVKIDSLGNLYIADEENLRVRKIQGASSATFPPTSVGQTSAAQMVSVVTTAPIEMDGAGAYSISEQNNQAQEFLVGSSSSNCSTGTVLPAGTVCTMSIAFRPLTTGPRDGQASVYTRSGNGSYCPGPVALYGSGVQ